MKKLKKHIHNNWVISGLVPDIRDDRDYVIKMPRGKKLKKGYPASVDLRNFAKDIENQGSVGSCVGNATSSCLELYAESQTQPPVTKNFSRLFIYWNARYLGNIKGDEGAYLRDGFKACNQFGICEEEHWLYDESKVNTIPDENSYDEARKNRVITYERIENNNINVFKSTLVQGKSIVIGIGLSNSFYSVTGPMPSQQYTGIVDNSDFVGGHAMNIVGYDDNLNGGSFIVENSWGTNWGDNGYFALPYTVWVKDAYDAWTCTNLKIDMDDKDSDYISEDPEDDPEIEPLVDELIDEVKQEAISFFTGKTKYERKYMKSRRGK